MPYNTRRKSLSLPSLGIHVPVTHAARAAAAAAAAAAAQANRASPIHHQHPTSSAKAHHSHGASSSPASAAPPSSSSSPTSSTSLASASPAHRPTSSTSSPSPPCQSSDTMHPHPHKKIKRSHSPSASPSAKRAHDVAALKLEHTPPPSPRAARSSSVEMVDADAPPARKVDLDSIHDEIVEAVVVQLQNTANRPHLVKELTAVLMQQLKVVQQSANPCAIISSRLATFLKRPCWNARNPCPLAKELETVHPRRTYFYLTTCPHLSLPDPSATQIATRMMITPSTTSASEEADEERRRELSPSPEVDLGSPEFDDMDDDIPMPSTPIGSHSVRLPHAAASMAHHQRGTSPPLEKDEKEFTQTADGLQKRKLSGHLLTASDPVDQPVLELDDAMKDDSLFNEPKVLTTTGIVPAMAFVSSPTMRPMFALNLKREGEVDSWAKLDGMLEWDRSPENIELEELDGLLTGF